MRENEIIIGAEQVCQALASGRQLEKVLIRRDAASEQVSDLLSQLRHHSMVQVQRVPQAKIDSFCRKAGDGVIAFLSKIEYSKMSSVIPSVFEQGRDPFLVLLDGVTDVRVFGSIARTTQAVGADAVVMPLRGGVMVTADALRASAGALSSLPVCKERGIIEAVRFARSSGLRVVAVSSGARKSFRQANFSGPLAVLVLGDAEANSEALLRMVDDVVSVTPGAAQPQLNVAVSAGIVLFEALYQRSQSPNNSSAASD